MTIIIMGVSGSGKSVIGKLLAERLSIPFIDADDYHPDSNLLKMRSGRPLNDSDRKPWLLSLRKEIEIHSREKGVVMACSALKRSYREILSGENPGDVCFIYLKGNTKIILDRMNQREGHFMPSALLDSQFATLEEPAANDAIHVSIEQTPEEIVTEILEKL